MTVNNALEVKAALITAARTAITDDTVIVRSGHPGVDQPNDIVAFTGLSWQEEPGPISTTRRTRDLTITLTARISIWRPGGEDQEAIAEARCLELADLIGDHLRNTDPTLGGKALWCFRTGYDSDGITPAEVVAEGRLIEADVVFTARARIATTS